MRQALLVIGTSMLSALLSIFLYRQFETPQKIIIRETVPATYTNLLSNRNENTSGAASLPAEKSFERPADFTSAARYSRNTVVNIQAFQTSSFNFWGRGSESSTGSGVLISPKGFIVTNYHVIEGARDIEVTLNDSRKYKAQVVGEDPSTDIALIQIKPEEDLPSIQFGNSDSLAVGEWVLAVGNPFNLESTVTAGIVSAKGRSIDILEGEYRIESFIQTDAAVNPGNSGGALINTRGELIGINTAIVTRTGRYEGYSFAVPSNLVRKVVEDLKDYGEVQRAILGVRISRLADREARQAGMSVPEGVFIEEVFNQSAAFDAGLKSGDIIIQINKTRIRSIPELQEHVALYRPGDKLEISYLRNGQLELATVVLKDLENRAAKSADAPLEINEEGLGFDLRNLTEKELEAFRLKGGVMVTRIRKGSIIDRTNMDPGFIITRVVELKKPDTGNNNKYPIGNLEELKEVLQRLESGSILLEGIYEAYPGDWGYTFELE